VNRVIGSLLGRDGKAAARASLFQQLDDLGMAAIPRGRDQVVSKDPDQRGVSPRVEQDSHGIGVSLADGEVNGLRVPVLGSVEVRIMREQAAEPGDISGGRRADRLPDVVTATRPGPVRPIGCELVRPDHLSAVLFNSCSLPYPDFLPRPLVESCRPRTCTA
jgi:hypothetical protein